MRGPTDVILDTLDQVDDEDLRRYSARILFWTVVVWFLNVVLWCLGVVSDSLNLFITLNLSWVAIVTTCAQQVITMDIKKTMDEPS
jgi:hypothetical protein